MHRCILWIRERSEEEKMMNHDSGGQTTVRGPTPARHHCISGPQKYST
jgi:hypothetical protein